MSGEAFLDTNIFVYSFDDTAPKKREIAEELIRQALREETAIISYQVVQEFLNAATRLFKQRLDAGDASRYLSATLEPLWKVSPSPELFQSAIAMQTRYRCAFYDALIIAAALLGGCRMLYSEDLQHGQRIEDLTIENPFRE